MRSSYLQPSLGEGFVSGIALSLSNLRPFGTPPSIGRRACPREPLPLEGAAERSEAGLVSFFAAKPPPLCLPHAGKALSIGIVFPTYPVFALTMREKRYPRFAAPYRNSIPIRTIKPPCGATCIAPQGGLYISTGAIPCHPAGGKGDPC